MPTRYQQLRQSVEILAATAEVQAAHLERLFDRRPLPAEFNTDELALELEDVWPYLGRAQVWISQHEIDAVQPLNALLERWSGEENHEFWTVGALFADPRWAEVRKLAAEALAALPDDIRALD